MSHKLNPLPPITLRYLLVINIPLYRAYGSLSAGDLWFKDLAAHVPYLKMLSIACPVLNTEPSEVVIPLSSDCQLGDVELVELPAAATFFGGILALPVTVAKLLKAIWSSDVVHTGIAGWPIPYGWVATPIAKLLRKKVVIIVESTPWRLNASLPTTVKTRISASVYETLGRWCVGRSDLAIFTQENYRNSLLRSARRVGHIINASWIDADSIITDEQAQDVWRQKLLVSESDFSVIYVGRLNHQKGLVLLLDAMRLVARKNLRIKLDIVGSGELAAMCHEVSQELTGLTRVRLLATVCYGPSLFELLRRYYAVVLPSVSDEQPRIVYDAYSQGVPVLAMRTTGLEACVVENNTGWFVRSNTADELSRLIERAAANVDNIKLMGMSALQVARSMTHQKMHRDRHKLLLDLLD